MRAACFILCLFFSAPCAAQPISCEELLEVAYGYFRNKQFKTCIPYFLETERCGLKTNAVYFSLGRAYLATDNYDSSIYYLNICDSVFNSDYLWVFGNRGIAMKQLKRYEEARKDLNQAIKIFEREILHPNNEGWMLYRERAWLNIETGKFSEAESDFNNAIEENPDTILNYVELCELHAITGEYQKILKQEENINFYCRDKGHLAIYTYYKYFAKAMLRQATDHEETELNQILQSAFSIIWYFDDFNKSLTKKNIPTQLLKKLRAFQQQILSKR
jgi:tetratricopeptide (TPR) repeat protein